MNFNQEMQNKISSMDPQKLKAVTEKAAQALGADGSKVNELLGNPQKLQQALSRLSPQDIAMIQSALQNPDKINDAISKANNTKRPNGQF